MNLESCSSMMMPAGNGQWVLMEVQSAPQMMLYPGTAIFLVVLGFNLLGDGLRDVLDPTTYRR